MEAAGTSPSPAPGGSMSAEESGSIDDRLTALESRVEGQQAEARMPWWIRWVAGTTAVFSALAAFAAVKSQGSANDDLYHSNLAVLYQSQASDAWNEFQSNSLKRHLCESSAAELRALGGAGNSAAPARAAVLDRQAREKYGPAATRL